MFGNLTSQITFLKLSLIRVKIIESQLYVIVFKFLNLNSKWMCIPQNILNDYVIYRRLD